MKRIKMNSKCVFSNRRSPDTKNYLNLDLNHFKPCFVFFNPYTCFCAK